MKTARYCVTVMLTLLGVPAQLAAQTTLVPTRAAPGFTMTIQGEKQGVFSAGKGGTIGGLRFSYRLASPRDAASGLASGKRVHSPVIFTKAVGAASTQIFAALSTNENLPSVVINVPGGEAGAGYRIKLTNAALSEIKQYTEVVNGATAVLEDVSFTFQKIEVQDVGTGTVATDDWSVAAL